MFDRILVTGGAGFIGSNFIRYVLEHFTSIFIFNLDLLTYAGNPENLKDFPAEANYQFIKGDIRDHSLVADLLRDKDINGIVHFAAESHVDRSIFGPSVFMNTNIMGTFTLLEAARQVWLTERNFSENDVRFHHISTDEVFGSLEKGEPAFSETTPYEPHSPYAATKASSDHLVRSYHHTYGLPITLTNCSNNYGPFQFPEKLIPLMILNILEGKPLPIYGDGAQVRDWLYVEDHCDAIWKVLQESPTGESYNIGGNNQPSNLEIVDTIYAIIYELRPDLPPVPLSDLIQFVPDRPGHDRRYAMNTSKIYRDLYWQPKYDLRSGLRETVEWYLDNMEWISTIREKKQFNDWIIQNYGKRGEE